VIRKSPDTDTPAELSIINFQAIRFLGRRLLQLYGDYPTQSDFELIEYFFFADYGFDVGH
jgi:hypothetical protein